MNIVLVTIIGILLLVCIILIIRIYSIKKGIREIERSLTYILKSDTNSLITISNNSVKNMAIYLNKELLNLRRQRLQYENGNKELKRNITNISHDLRTPLTAIKGYIDLLETSNLSNKEVEYLNIVNKKVEELTELTNQLFDFSKTIDTYEEVKKEKCCLNEILEEVLASYYAIYKEKNIIPEILICDEKIYRKLNKSSIIRVFENILSNILKYGDDSFKVELQNDGTIIFSNKTNSLDNTTVQKIFDRYFSVENAKKSTGIGLSIAKHLVELNNGIISAKYENNILFIEIKFKECE